jgi:hypothetical protein
MTRKISERDRAKRRARQAKYRQSKRGEKAETALEHNRELRTELAELRRANSDLQDRVNKAAAFEDNLRDRRAPLDIDAFVNGSGVQTKDGDAPHVRSKKQEYNNMMGMFTDFLAQPDRYTDAQIRKLALFQAALAEDESRFLSRRDARLTAIHSARNDLFLRNFMVRANDLFKDKIKPSGFALTKPHQKSERVLNLHLSDLHIGSRLAPDEFPEAANPQTEARRLGALFMETAEYKTQYRERTRLNVHLNGDLLQGLLRHSFAIEEDPLTDQFARVLHMLCQGLAYVAKHFPAVEVFCQTGNHGRNITVHPGRATAQKWDSFETMVYIALRLACGNLTNVKFHIPKTPYCAVPLFDKWALLTHGDTVINAGNPSKNLNIDGILKQSDRINATKMYGHQYSVIMIGHVHTALMLEFAGGTLIVNGAATPSNGHSLSLGYPAACAQWLFESVKDHPVGDSRLLRLGPSIDNDAVYEKVIQPVDWAA